MTRAPAGVIGLGAFFGAGALIAGSGALALAFPGSWLEPMWRLNPDARVAFARLGFWAVVLMGSVAGACGAAALGLWSGRRWGYLVAVTLLTVNLLGDALNALLRHDPRTLVGLPIGGAMLAYLGSRRIRQRFRRGSSRHLSGELELDPTKPSPAGAADRL